METHRLDLGHKADEEPLDPQERMSVPGLGTIAKQ